MSGLEVTAKIVLEAIPVSVGISIATSQMQSSSHDQGSKPGGDGGSPRGTGDDGGSMGLRTARQYVKVLGGAFYMGYNFAPITDLSIVAFSIEWWLLLLMVTLSLAVSFNLSSPLT